MLLLNHWPLGPSISEEIIQAQHPEVNLSKKRSRTLSTLRGILAKRNYATSSDKNRKLFDPDHRSTATERLELWQAMLVVSPACIVFFALESRRGFSL